jgi:outer membrane protein insertion porin family
VGGWHRYWRALGLALALLWASPAYAEIPAEWLGAKVVALRVVGPAEGNVEPRELGVPIGAPLNRALVRTALARLTGSGRWADVQVDAERLEDGVVLLFQLQPRLTVRRVDAVGNQVLDAREVERVIGMREESEIDVERFPAQIEALKQEYQSHGRFETEVQIALRDTDDPALKVVRVEIQEGPATTIGDVQFRGEPLPRRRGVRWLLGVGVGAPADLAKIQEGLEKTEQLLRRNGYYASELGQPSLERHRGRATVVVESTIGPRYEVRFTGQGQLRASELYASLALEQERFTGEGSLRAIEQKVADYYRHYSFRAVEVHAQQRLEIRRQPAPEGRLWEERVMVIDVQITPGTQTTVDAITFPGATHFSTAFLREQVYSYLEQELPGSSTREPVDSDVADRLGLGGARATRAREIPKPLLLDPRRMFHASTYDDAVEHIRELYRGEGYLDVVVDDVKLTPLAEPDHVVARISVAEGARTFLHDVQIENNRQLSSRALLIAAGLSREQPFSYLKLEEARLRMIAACQEEGFFFCQVEPSVRRSGDGTRADVQFRIEEGYPVRVGAVDIRGADRSSHAMIRNRVRFALGDLYRPSRARETQEALNRLDVFSSVTVAPDEPNLPARVKTVIVTVTERKTQWLGWNAGFSTGEGVRGGLEYGYRNLFGSAVHASFRGQLGYQLVFLDSEFERRFDTLPPDQQIEYQVTLGLGIPYLPHTPKTTVSFDVSALADIQRDFRMQKEAGVGSVVYRPQRRVTLTVAQELEFSNFRLFEQDLDNIGNLTVNDLVPEGQNTLLSTQFNASWDHRDRAFNAHRGFLVSGTSEWARTLRDNERTATGAQGMDTVVFKSNMLRFSASFAFYIPLGAKVTFASQTRYGRIVHLEKGSEAYPNRRFYLGGTNFRGFYQNQMVPQDLQDDPNLRSGGGIISRGGDTFIASQNELRFPLVGELYGGIFCDVGNLWAKAKNFDLRQVEPVVGMGLRFNTPVASLAFDYGVRAIDTSPFGLVGAFQFAFQTF